MAVQIADKENMMEMIWKYKIELKDLQAFEEVETLRGIHIPEELKSFVTEHNAGNTVALSLHGGFNRACVWCGTVI